MVKQLLILLFTLVPVITNAQPPFFKKPGLKPPKVNDKPYRYFPQFGTSATFAPGFMSGQKSANYYLHGHAFVFIDRLVSLRGDAFVSLRSNNADRIFEMHHTFSAGPSLHILHGDVADPYIGLGVGFSYSRLKSDLIGEPNSNALNPLVMPHLGCRFYAEQWFYFFAETHYAIGKHFAEQRPAVKFNELRFAAGLGFQISKRVATQVPNQNK
jgi:hypothetical protein